MEHRVVLACVAVLLTYKACMSLKRVYMRICRRISFVLEKNIFQKKTLLGLIFIFNSNKQSLTKHFDENFSSLDISKQRAK